MSAQVWGHLDRVWYDNDGNIEAGIVDLRGFDFYVACMQAAEAKSLRWKKAQAKRFFARLCAKAQVQHSVGTHDEGDAQAGRKSSGCVVAILPDTVVVDDVRLGLPASFR